MIDVIHDKYFLVCVLRPKSSVELASWGEVLNEKENNYWVYFINIGPSLTEK